MSNAENGGPAFPVSTRMGEMDDNPHGYGHQDTASTWQFPGMTLRDYFAAKVLQGMFSNPLVIGSQRRFDSGNFEAAWQAADAILAAREAKP